MTATSFDDLTGHHRRAASDRRGGLLDIGEGPTASLTVCGGNRPLG